MKADYRAAWVTIGLLVAISIAMLVSARLAHADAPTLADRLVSAQSMFRSKTEASVDARELAEAVARESKGNPRAAALLLTIAVHESGLRERVRLDQYGPHEGDSYKAPDGSIVHRASGLYQVHRSSHNAGVWGSPDVAAQTRMAAHVAAGAFARCKKSLAPYPVNVFRGYRGGNCDLPLKGEEQRAVTYQRVLERIQ